MTDVSEYSAVRVSGDFVDGKDRRWLEISWDGSGLSQEGRYRLVVDPEDGTVIFVDEEDDNRQPIDYRNLAVLVERARRVRELAEIDRILGREG